MNWYIISYIIVLSLIGFSSMGIDKWKATHHKYRISEKNLLLIAMLGGSIGSLIGMKCFHHKTLHKKFSIGVPMILLIQILLVTLYCLSPILQK